MPRYVNYYDDWRESAITCEQCGWRGIGGQTSQSEVFEQLYERDCPICAERLLVVSFPTLDEVAEAAKRGVPEAIRELETISRNRGELDP